MLFQVFEKFILPQLVNQILARLLVDGSRRKIKYDSWQSFIKNGKSTEILIKDIQACYESIYNKDLAGFYKFLVSFVERRFVEEKPKNIRKSSVIMDLPTLYPEYSEFDSEQFVNRDDDHDLMANFVYACLNPSFTTLDLVCGLESECSSSEERRYDEMVIKFTFDRGKKKSVKDNPKFLSIYKIIEKYIGKDRHFNFMLVVDSGEHPYITLSNFKLRNDYTILSSKEFDYAYQSYRHATDEVEHSVYSSSSMIHSLAADLHWKNTSEANIRFPEMTAEQRFYRCNNLSLYNGKSYFFTHRHSVIDEFKGDLVEIFNKRIESFHKHNDVYKIMFSGKPGGGKSLLAKSLALNKRVLEISNGTFGDIDNASFDNAVISLSPDFIIIDDVSDVHSTLTRKLDAFDGYSELFSHYKENNKKLVIIMTCNDPKNIKSSFLRPGRIDEFVDFDLLMNDKPERYRVIVDSLISKREVEIDDVFKPLLVEIFRDNTVVYVDEIVKRFKNFGSFRFENYDSHWNEVSSDIKTRWNNIVDEK